MRWALLAMVLVAGACSAKTEAPKTDAVKSFLPAEAQRAVVRVVTFSPGDKSSAGSGFAVAPNLILTNAHVIGDDPDASLIAVWDADSEYPREANAVIATDSRLDLALLYVRGVKAVPVTFSVVEPHQADSISAVGFPMSTDLAFGRLTSHASITAGQITAIDRGQVGPGSDVRLINHTGTINPGNSGGPLYNSCGDVIGINTLRADPSRTSNVYLASSAAEIVPFLFSFGVTPQIAHLACPAKGAVIAGCINDTADADKALKAGEFDKVQSLMASKNYCPESAAALQATYVYALADVIGLEGLLSGRWHLPDSSCTEGVRIEPSGLALAAQTKDEFQYESITGFDKTSVTTKAISDDGTSEFRYVPTDATMTIYNKTSGNSWELQRCTN